MKNEKFIAKAAKALGDRNRLRILQAVAQHGKITCTQAQQLTNLAQPSVSHHIKLLTDCELIEAEKEGRTIYLVLNRPKLDEFISVFGPSTLGSVLAEQGI